MEICFKSDRCVLLKQNQDELFEGRVIPRLSQRHEYLIKYTSWFWVRRGALLSNALIQTLSRKRRLIY